MLRTFASEAGKMEAVSKKAVAEMDRFQQAELALRKYKPRYYKMEGRISTLGQLKHLPGMGEVLEYERDHGLKYPVLTNEYYESLIDRVNPEDPLRKLVVPAIEELRATTAGASKERGLIDTSGEAENLKHPGLQHKYSPTALALVSSSCFGLCRECFRKRLFIDGDLGQEETVFPNVEAVEYLKEHREINTILLTGGDALMLTTSALSDVLTILAHPDLEHISTVRLGTKSLAFCPQRIDAELCEMLEAFSNRTGKSVHVCGHFELAREITPECIAACKRLREHSIHLYNQTVLLAGVNDDPDVLWELWEAMQKAGIRPYFLFQCRPVLGSKEMQVTLKRGIEICKEVNRRLTGVHKPRYAMSTVRGKLEIMGVNPRNEDEIVVRQHSAKVGSRTNDILFYDVTKNDPYWFLPKDDATL